MLRKRVVTALCGIPLLIVAIWFDGPWPWFTILAAVWGLLAVLEFYKMVGVVKFIPLTCFGMVWTLLFILHPHYDYELTVPLLLTSGIALSLILLLFSLQKEGAVTNWAWIMVGILYVGWLLSYLVTLRLDAGRDWLYLALFATFGSDTAAYFLGKAFGKHKLAPLISPGKTWEGAVAGLFGAVIISLLFTLDTPLQLPLSYWQAILLGVLISIFGQIGDLVESLLKRNSGVKESGNLMPGHGGLLDRMDSVVFAGIVVYLYYIFMVV
ncbi:MAG: phosphatidate cytidylyltransferase [Dehalococcoidales bacterium]|nr:phosphatidate cytidylyltransferase [Dehalococcoidales bacterium]